MQNANSNDKDVEPENPLKKANEVILQWIYSTGTDDQKKAIEAELVSRIDKWEREARYAESRVEIARRTLERVTSSEPL